MALERCPQGCEITGNETEPGAQNQGGQCATDDRVQGCGGEAAPGAVNAQVTEKDAADDYRHMTRGNAADSETGTGGVTLAQGHH